jgi:acyl-coenzyme A synthetase/AMP-(fatty) acid ligase
MELKNQRGQNKSDGDNTWHRMGDVGYIDDKGKLWFCGRKSHVVHN